MPTPIIAIADYNAGNLRSVQKALERFDARAEITSSPERIAKADALVVPGQGACDSSMRHLRERELVEPIREFIQGGRPFSWGLPRTSTSAGQFGRGRRTPALG